MQVEDLLQQCTVKLSIPGQLGWGTGFFVAPGLILTCAHVVKALVAPNRVRVRWQQQVDFAEAELVERVPDLDLALLQFTPGDTDLPCVYLDEGVQVGQDLYFFGYPDEDFEHGCPVTGSCEGFTGDVSPLIKFKQAQVRPGMSGSALLNRQTRKVCGMVKFTRNRSIDLGGGAIPTHVILAHFPKLRDLQQEFHGRDWRWSNLIIFGGEHHHYPAASQRSPTGILNNLPRMGVNEFVGRVAELQELHRQLQPGKSRKIVAVSGMGGVGKTELALQYALEHLESPTPIYTGGIGWLWAREALGLQILAFARLDDLKPPDDLELQEQVRWCWQHWRAGEVLVILDDVQDYEGIEPFFPVESRFRILLTTRHTLGSPVQNLEIQVLEEYDALTLLRALVTDGRIAQQPKNVKQLCQWLGNLPLGLELVGRYLARKPDVSVKTVLDRLEAKHLEAKALKDVSPEMTASLGIAAAFELSWQELTEAARELAAFLSLFALAEIPWVLVQGCLIEQDEEELEDLRDDELLNLHLLQRTRQGLYQLHQLLREFFAAKRQQMQDEANLKQLFCNSLSALSEEILNRTPTYSLNLPTLEQIAPTIPHLKEIVTTLESCLPPANFITTTTAIARFYRGQAAYAEAGNWYLYCYMAAEKRLGAAHIALAPALNNLALFYQTIGHYKEAEGFFLRAFNIRQKDLGDNHPDVAQSLNNIACLYEAQSRDQEAEPLLRRALSIWQRCYGDQHPDIGIAQSHLARLCQHQGRFDDARTLYCLSLNIFKSYFGSNHPSVAAICNNLASLCQLQNRYREAEEFYQLALSIDQQYYGDNHPEVATVLNNLATVYTAQRRYDEAESLCLQALDIQQQKLGSRHPQVAVSLDHLARLYASQERFDQAESCYLQALDIHVQTLDSQHPTVIERLHNLAQFYQQDERTILNFERRSNLSQLASLCISNSLYGDAEFFYQRSLEIYQNHYGDDHPEVAVDLNNLALLYQSQVRFEEAERLYLKALDIWQRQLNSYHSHIEKLLHNLGVLYQLQGRYDEAVAYFEQSLAISEQSPNKLLSSEQES